MDNSPSALLIPTSIFDVLEEADDYYFPPITGTYIRVTRYLITIASVLLTPLWLLCLQNPEHVPRVFRFVLNVEPTSLPIFWQLIIMELCIDGLRLAALHTPSSLTSAIGIIGAIAFSQFAVDAGWFTTASTLYVAFVTIANYSQPNYELGYSLKYARFILLTATYLGNLIGFILGIAALIALHQRQKLPLPPHPLQAAGAEKEADPHPHEAELILILNKLPRCKQRGI